MKFSLPLCSALSLVSICSMGSGFAQAKKTQPYNILWLSCEDLTPLMGAYGHPEIQTPNIDRLAREGITYTNAFATVGVSAPSRSSIITGMYPVAIGSHNMRTGDHWGYKGPDRESYNTNTRIKDLTGRTLPEYSVVAPVGVKCFTEYLRAAGYFCTNNPKCDYQFACPISAWDEVGDQASYQNRGEGQPFFAVFNLGITHESQIWKKKNDPMLMDSSKVVVPAYFPNIPIVRQDVARKYSNVMELDRQIGEYLDKLEKEGLLERTIIFFWSDHGGPLLREKRAVGNSGLRVPMIVRFPDKKMAGTSVEEIVSLMDLGPTVMSLAGLEPPAYMHGKAFLGSYKSKVPHQYAFGSADRFDETTDRSRSVIDGRFVYIRNFLPQLPYVYRNNYREQIDMTRELLAMNARGDLLGDAGYIFMESRPVEELYDLATDPYEVHNVAGDPKHREKLLELRAALGQWQLEVGDKGFIPEYDLIQMMWPGFVQPQTTPVQYRQVAGKKVELFNQTPGSSFVYRIEGEESAGRWQLYTTPLTLPKGTKVAARACRIGYKTSGEVSFVVE